jgi:hypothetical protein
MDIGGHYFLYQRADSLRLLLYENQDDTFLKRLFHLINSEIKYLFIYLYDFLY